METAIETAAKVIFEKWGGPWSIAPEFRREQARKEALSVFEAIQANQVARDELLDFLHVSLDGIKDLVHAAQLAEGRLELLIQNYPDESDTCDHPVATRYVLGAIKSAITKATS